MFSKIMTILIYQIINIFKLFLLTQNFCYLFQLILTFFILLFCYKLNFTN